MGEEIMPNQYDSWNNARNCEECGKEFFPSTKKQSSCSEKCSHLISNKKGKRKLDNVVTAGDLGKMGYVRSQKIVAFISRCKRNGIDYRDYNLKNMGSRAVRTLSRRLFGVPKQGHQDAGYSVSDKANETKREKMMRND